MYIIRKFNHKLIEGSHIKFEIQLPKLWDLEVQFWVPILKAIRNTEKFNMKMGWNFDRRLK